MNTENTIEQRDFQAGGVALVSSAHAVHDTYTAYLPALLPVLIEKFSLTNTLGGLLSVFLQLPSLLQPVIGRIADRKNLRLFIIFTPAITGIAMSLLSVAPTYGFLVLLLMIAGISSASLHSVGPVLGSSLSGSKLRRGMSFWMVGGELGRSLGPIVMVTAIGHLTLDGLPWLMIAGILISIFLYGKLNSLTTISTEKVAEVQWKTALLKMRKVMIPITLAIFARALMHAALGTYLPTFLTNNGASLWVAGASLTIFQAAGVAGAFLAGALSDRFGRRRMLLISYIGSPILMLLFLRTSSIWQIPLLILLGFFVVSSVPVFMAIVLENAPDNRAFANGVYMAVSFIISSLSILIVGMLSDFIDLRFTFMISAGLLPLGIPIIFLLPKSNVKGSNVEKVEV